MAISSVALTFRSGSPGLPAIVFAERPVYVNLVGCETTLRVPAHISRVAFVRLDQLALPRHQAIQNTAFRTKTPQRL